MLFDCKSDRLEANKLIDEPYIKDVLESWALLLD
jgi:hypothetical protein